MLTETCGDAGLGFFVVSLSIAASELGLDLLDCPLLGRLRLMSSLARPDNVGTLAEFPLQAMHTGS